MGGSDEGNIKIRFRTHVIQIQLIDSRLACPRVPNLIDSQAVMSSTFQRFIRSTFINCRAGPSRLRQAKRSIHSSFPKSTSTPNPAFSTINSSEIDHFSKLSSQWWDQSPRGEFSLLHKMNPPRVEYIRQKIALDDRDEAEWTFEGRHLDRVREEGRGRGRWLEGRRCLDVGCGGGLLSEVT